MKIIQFIFMFWILMGLSISARNHDSRKLESRADGVFIVKAVFVDSDGVKWFGTNRGLCRYDNLTWRYYTDADHLVGNQVNALTFEQTDNGSELWVATTDGISLVTFDSGGVTGTTSYTTVDGLLDNNVTDITIDSYARKFFGSAGGITMFHDGIMDSIIYSKYPDHMVNSPVIQMDIFSDTLYIAANGGIGRFVSGVDGITGASRWTSEYGVSPYSDHILSVKIDAGSKRWFGTDVGVQKHFGDQAKQNWSLYSSNDGLINNYVISISEDKNGGLWFGTHGGVSHFRDETWVSYTSADGLLNDTVYDIGFDVDGSVWFATATGVCRLKNGEFKDFYTSVPKRLSTTLGMQVFYNHTRGSIHLSYVLEHSAPVQAKLYSVSGMLVGEWHDLPSSSGEHQLDLPLSGHLSDGSPGGIYVLQMDHGNRSGSAKLIISQ